MTVENIPPGGIAHTIRAHRRIWRFYGLLSHPGDTILYTLYAWLWHINMWLFVGCILLSFAKARSMADCIEVLLLSTTFVLLIIKAFLLRRSFPRVEAIIRLMESIESTMAQRPSEHQLLQAAARRCNHMYWLMAFFCYFGCASIPWQPLLGGERLVYPSWYPFDYAYARWTYYATFAYQVLSNVQVVSFFPSGDVYGPAMFLYLATYLEILGKRLEELGKNDVSDVVSRGELIDCVRLHTSCLRLLRQLNEQFGIHYAIQFSTSSFIICVAAFQFSLIKPLQQPADVVFLTEYLLAMAAEIFLPCYCGSLLIVYSDDLSRAAYRCNWTAMSPAFKSTMSIFMERAKWPVSWHIYRRFCYIHLGSFVNITRFAYSLLTFLKSFQD